MFTPEDARIRSVEETPTAGEDILSIQKISV